jgi:hypothetical protein
MNPDSTAAELLETFQRVGVEAFAAMLIESGVSATRMLELSEQVMRLPAALAEQALSQQVKKDPFDAK